MISIDGNRIAVDTRTLTAVIENGVLVSLVRKSDGRAFIHTSAAKRAPLEMIYPGQELVALGLESGDRHHHLTP